MRNLEEATIISPQVREILAEIKDRVLRIFPGATVLVYGSVARGTQSPDSDYDILVLTDTALTFDEQQPVRDLIFDLELARGIICSTVYASTQEWNTPPLSGSPFRYNVEREAVVL